MAGALTFIDKLVSREQRYALGTISETGQPYVSIPVSNGRVDYEEYYLIDSGMFENFLANPQEALTFVDRCRRRQEDVRLLYPPGADRGTALT